MAGKLGQKHRKREPMLMSDEHRNRIGKSNILARLMKFSMGEIEMSPHQVTAALGLLRKVLPDLASQELKVTDATPFAVIPEQIQDVSEWQDRFTPVTKTEH